MLKDYKKSVYINTLFSQIISFFLTENEKRQENLILYPSFLKKQAQTQ